MMPTPRGQKCAIYMVPDPKSAKVYIYMMSSPEKPKYAIYMVPTQSVQNNPFLWFLPQTAKICHVYRNFPKRDNIAN